MGAGALASAAGITTTLLAAGPLKSRIMGRPGITAAGGVASTLPSALPQWLQYCLAPIVTRSVLPQFGHCTGIHSFNAMLQHLPSYVQWCLCWVLGFFGTSTHIAPLTIDVENKPRYSELTFYTTGLKDEPP